MIERFHREPSTPASPDAFPPPGHIEIDGDHEALLTAPHRLAWALLASLRPTDK
jgi:hypothetical protein